MERNVVLLGQGLVALGRRDKAGMLDKWDWGGLDRRMQRRVGKEGGADNN